jgi:hypothetical protein
MDARRAGMLRLCSEAAVSLAMRQALRYSRGFGLGVEVIDLLLVAVFDDAAAEF